MTTKPVQYQGFPGIEAAEIRFVECALCYPGGPKPAGFRVIIHQYSTEWVEITQDDILRPEFRLMTGLGELTQPRVQDVPVDIAAMLREESIGGTVHTSLRALVARWGVGGARAIEELYRVDQTSFLGVKIRWSDRAVRITRLDIGPSWGAFGDQPISNA